MYDVRGEIRSEGMWLIEDGKLKGHWYNGVVGNTNNPDNAYMKSPCPNCDNWHIVSDSCRNCLHCLKCCDCFQCDGCRNIFSEYEDNQSYAWCECENKLCDNCGKYDEITDKVYGKCCEAESFEAERFGKGRRILSNTEILKILPNQQYKCAVCLEGYYKPLKEIQLMDLIQMPKYELLNNPDYNININIVRPRSVGGRMRLPTGELIEDNIEICCDECAETEQFTATMPKVMMDQLRRGAEKKGITPARHIYDILKLIP